MSAVSSAGSPNYITQGNLDLGYQPVTIYPAGAAEFAVRRVSVLRTAC
ncbi:protein of unknown function [Ralstonia solanacearum CMR15]|nr:protein of unknown function [Ralstonia solanacearum CMR15]